MRSQAWCCCCAGSLTATRSLLACRSAKLMFEHVNPKNGQPAPLISQEVYNLIMEVRARRAHLTTDSNALETGRRRRRRWRQRRRWRVLLRRAARCWCMQQLLPVITAVVLAVCVQQRVCARARPCALPAPGHTRQARHPPAPHRTARPRTQRNTTQHNTTQNADRLDSEIIYDRDFDYDYFGFKVRARARVARALSECVRACVYVCVCVCVSARARPHRRHWQPLLARAAHPHAQQPQPPLQPLNNRRWSAATCCACTARSWSARSTCSCASPSASTCPTLTPRSRRTTCSGVRACVCLCGGGVPVCATALAATCRRVLAAGR
jgi:hypothetical protein